MIEKPYSYTLNDIASWQLEHEKSNVELPALQRGFVWKVNQIESLWDSLLRGFPIGSFLLSKSEDDKLFLLDGQQRATSIAIGHYDPWQMADSLNSKFWSLKNIPIGDEIDYNRNIVEKYKSKPQYDEIKAIFEYSILNNQVLNNNKEVKKIKI